MTRNVPCQLVTRDFHILQSMLAERHGRNDPLEPLLREKLTAAKILLPHEVPPDVVTLYSRVRYRVGTQAPTTRVIIHDAAHEMVGATLPITHPRGLALLGLAERAAVTAPDAQGNPQPLYIDVIVYQPQAERRKAEGSGSTRLHSHGNATW
jgi:regulator of nucleoside diphosphate kinase